MLINAGTTLNGLLRALTVFIDQEHLSVVLKVHDFGWVHASPNR